MPRPVSSAHDEAVLRVTSYHRKDFDLAVTWFATREHAIVRDALLSTNRRPTASLGELDRLPLELINAICLELDVSSCFAFRHVNLRAQQVVNSLPQYRIAVIHSINCFCAILRTKVASSVTLSEYYCRLCQTQCSLCGVNYGDLIHLLNWTRCCSACLRNHVPQVRVLTSTAARRVLRLSSKMLETIPTLQTLPGIYSMDERAYKIRYTIMTVDSALSAYRGQGRKLEVQQNQLKPKFVLAFTGCCAFPSYCPETGRIQNGVSCAGCQVALEESDGRLDSLAVLRDLVYSRASFLKHFATCEQAQLLWESSDNGLIEPTKMPHGCKIGGFFALRE